MLCTGEVVIGHISPKARENVSGASVQVCMLRLAPGCSSTPSHPQSKAFFFLREWGPQCSYPRWGRQSQCAVCTVGWWLDAPCSNNHSGGMCEVHPGGDPIVSCPTIQRPGGRRKEGQFAVVLSSGSGHPSCSGECLHEGGSSVTRSVGQGRSRSTESWCIASDRACSEARLG